MDSIDITIIGAGVVGLAIAAELSTINTNLAILVIEQYGVFGRETSSRNSEVIHSGIYYPHESLKARLCVNGNELLYQFCKKWQVDYKKIGKLIIARDEGEIEYLNTLLAAGKIDKEEVAILEPHIQAQAAIYSPSTGIVDSHQLMARLAAIAADNNVLFAYRHKVIGFAIGKDHHEVIMEDPQGQESKICSRIIINSAGLEADKVAQMQGLDIVDKKYKIHPCKGEYFSITASKARLVNHLIYPPPLKDLKGLGVHVTKSLDGRAKLGPNALYTDKIEYTVAQEHQKEFYQGVKGYLPFLEFDDIQPDMSGVRPKIQGPGEAWRDFVIQEDFPGIINLIGIESPGLTSCLAIAQYVRTMINF